LAKTVFDYTDENKDSKQKTERLAAINELIEMLNDQRMVTSLFIPHLDLVMEMITKNIFRPLPSLKKNGISLGMQETGVESDVQESDPSWHHIRGIYEIFLQFIVNDACDVKTFKSYITTNFISEVIYSKITINYFIIVFNLVPSIIRLRRNRRKRLSEKHLT
jgi:serine/threonine-protein phosphatase 2A regulatory subunit B'